MITYLSASGQEVTMSERIMKATDKNQQVRYMHLDCFESGHFQHPFEGMGKEIKQEEIAIDDVPVGVKCFCMFTIVTLEEERKRWIREEKEYLDSILAEYKDSAVIQYVEKKILHCASSKCSSLSWFYLTGDDWECLRCGWRRPLVERESPFYYRDFKIVWEDGIFRMYVPGYSHDTLTLSRAVSSDGARVLIDNRLRKKKRGMTDEEVKLVYPNG